MLFPFTCSCGKEYQLNVKKAGKPFTCFNCQTRTIPMRDPRKNTAAPPQEDVEEVEEIQFVHVCACGKEYHLPTKKQGKPIVCFLCGVKAIAEPMDETAIAARRSAKPKLKPPDLAKGWRVVTQRNPHLVFPHTLTIDKCAGCGICLPKQSTKLARFAFAALTVTVAREGVGDFVHALRPACMHLGGGDLFSERDLRAFLEGSAERKYDWIDLNEVSGATELNRLWLEPDLSREDSASILKGWLLDWLKSLEDDEAEHDSGANLNFYFDLGRRLQMISLADCQSCKSLLCPLCVSDGCPRCQGALA